MKTFKKITVFCLLQKNCVNNFLKKLSKDNNFIRTEIFINFNFNTCTLYFNINSRNFLAPRY